MQAWWMGLGDFPDLPVVLYLVMAGLPLGGWGNRVLLYLYIVPPELSNTYIWEFVPGAAA